jgi:hypothetical protein
MTDEADAPTYSVLERLDLALAQRLTQRADRLDLQQRAEQGVDLLGLPRGRTPSGSAACSRCAASASRRVTLSTCSNARSRHFMPDHQEHSLIVGLKGVLNLIRERGSRGVPPDGWCLVDLFRVLTRDIARFRGNDLRRDQPWDAILYVRYPPADDVRTLLDTFHPTYCFRDLPQAFERLHPVRKAFRILWRFARIAPFPDFNLVMAFVAMNSSLLANGYPPVFPEPGDREVLTHLVTGPVPQRITGFEARLLQVVEKT